MKAFEAQSRFAISIPANDFLLFGYTCQVTYTALYILDLSLYGLINLNVSPVFLKRFLWRLEGTAADKSSTEQLLPRHVSTIKR